MGWSLSRDDRCPGQGYNAPKHPTFASGYLTRKRNRKGAQCDENHHGFPLGPPVSPWLPGHNLMFDGESILGLLNGSRATPTPSSG